MNDTRQDNDLGRTVGPIVGFAVGALVGAGLALLLAPASGEKTRRRLGNAARRMGRDARHTLDEARESVTDATTGLGSDLKSAMDAGLETLRHEGKPHEAHPVSRIAQTLSPPPRTP